MSAPLVLSELQGNILRGYNFKRVRHLVLQVNEPAAARAWLAAMVSGRPELAPQLTSAQPWPSGTKPESCVNLALTAQGLAALGVSGSSLDSFPEEFRWGMASRAIKLGDVGDSAPQHWAAPFDDPSQVHLVLSIHANDAAPIEAVQQRVLAAGGGRAFRLLPALPDGVALAEDKVHFGYRDSISQPRFPGIHDPEQSPDAQPLAPLGTVLLGFPTAFEGLVWRVPQPQVLGLLGSFSAFRVLAQDVAGFEAYLDRAARVLMDAQLTDPSMAEELLPPGQEAAVGAGLSRFEALRELVAAKLCGRWRNGVPLALSPNTPTPDPQVSLTDFNYKNTQDINDNDGARCPYGAHTRRCNPRGSTIVQRVANHTRRLVRRGVPYGRPYQPGQPDDEERGLLGVFLCANLAAQFEAVTCDWLNLGLQDPRITGSNDPLLGANAEVDSWFDIPLPSGRVIRLRELPRLVATRGGAYLFHPSLPAVRHLGELRG